MSAFAYAVTSQKATAVKQSLMCCWTAPGVRNLIIAKGTSIEVHALLDSGLEPVTTLSLNGAIIDMAAYRVKGADQDLLFVLTERKYFCVLAYDAAAQRVLTRATGNLAARTGRDADEGQRAFMDPSFRMMGMHLYDGHLKVRGCECVSV